jgi:starch phosphorylase
MDKYVPLPPLPERIGRLNELAYDLWWSWNPAARDVFRSLDYPLWRFTDHNPVLLLHLVEQERLEHAAANPEFLRLYDAAVAALDVVRAGTGTWWSRRETSGTTPVACICPEFALHQSLPLDTAGVGVVAGDYCKEASDLGVPIVGVGLMYPRGYLHQRISGEGWQQESYEYLDWSDAPIVPATTADGARCAFTLTLASGELRVEVWGVRAGHVTLYLLDTDASENAAWDRPLSSTSFGDDAEGQTRQSMLLGVGAVRALRQLGIEPGVWHVHEGLSAFVALERLQALMTAGAGWDAALDRVRQTTVFNTRAEAPPRREQIPFAALERHAAACWPALQASRDRVLALGAVETDRGAFFNAGILGARAAAIVNAPAEAGAVDGWGAAITPSTMRVSIPAGVHLPTWVAREMATLFERHLGAGWIDHQDDAAWWDPLRDIPDAEVWAVRQRLRAYLVNFTRERARRRWVREQTSGARLVALGTLLDPATLTIGFARRFTEDARAELVFQDAPRLARIVTAARRPVQLLFAGKAHPGDEAGKHHLQRVFRQALDPVFGGRVAFLEDYDLHAARLLVQGCDVWLSTSRRGTLPSMGALKAAVNGVPHLATPGGWSAETWMGNGWVADGGRAADAASQDAADSRALYRLLEEEIVPAFYDRDSNDVPARWVAAVKASMTAGVPRFCARRAVKASAARLYVPAPVPR